MSEKHIIQCERCGADIDTELQSECAQCAQADHDAYERELEADFIASRADVFLPPEP